MPLVADRAAAVLRACMRSATASACARSSLPARKARWVNSPGSASLAPASRMARRTACGAALPPCVVSSTTSSPVALVGPRKTVATAWSTRSPLASVTQPTCAVWVGASASLALVNRLAAMLSARSPLMRTTARALSPLAVASAAMVSVMRVASGAEPRTPCMVSLRNAAHQQPLAPEAATSCSCGRGRAWHPQSRTT